MHLANLPARLTDETGRHAPGHHLEHAVVHVVTGSFGAGHDAAAREIAVRLREAGHRVVVSDVVDLFPARLGRLVRAAYLLQLRVSPASWGSLLSVLEPGRLAHRLVGRLLALSSRRLLALAGDGTGAELVVSTHPFASQALGRLRAEGRLAAPVVTYLTDMSVHPLWVHPAVDLHLAVHEVAAGQARRWGGRTAVVEPLTPRPCGPVAAVVPSAPSSDQVRRELGLAPADRVALVVGGSLGIGELEESAVEVLATGLARPVVLCGHNEGLRRRLARHPGVVALGWRDDVRPLLAIADCVVQNAGGFMSLEALAAGVPVLTHRALPGHGTTNAAALEEAGLAPWSRSVAELEVLLGLALERGGARRPAPGPGLLEALATVAPALAPAPDPATLGALAVPA